MESKPELLDVPAAAQKLGPRDVRQHEHGEAELVVMFVHPERSRPKGRRRRGDLLLSTLLPKQALPSAAVATPESVMTE